jgi:hypothetical protein
MKISNSPSSMSIITVDAGVFRSRSIVLNCAITSATEPMTSTSAIAQ